MKENLTKVRFMAEYKAFLESHDEEVLQVASGAYAIPYVDAEGNEGYVKVVFSVPKGARDGEGYDGHAEAQNYVMETAQKAEKAKAAKEAKAKKIKRDEALRAKKATEKEKA